MTVNAKFPLLNRYALSWPNAQFGRAITKYKNCTDSQEQSIFAILILFRYSLLYSFYYTTIKSLLFVLLFSMKLSFFRELICIIMRCKGNILR
jgi:ABC-type microcin C transport system permease subunit YejE